MSTETSTAGEPDEHRAPHVDHAKYYMRAGQAGAKYSMRASQTGSKYSMSADQRTPSTSTCARQAGPKYNMRAGQTHSTASLATRTRSARYARGIRCAHGDAAEPADQRRDAS